jgi:hypothetical protein
MKTIVQVFEPGQAESMTHPERKGMVVNAIAHHARQLREIAELLQEIFEQPEPGRSVQRIDKDNFLPTLQELVKERSAILAELEHEFDRLDEMVFEERQPPGPKASSLVTA